MRGLHGKVPGGGGALLLPLNDLDTQPHGPVILRSLAEPAGAASSAGRPQGGLSEAGAGLACGLCLLCVTVLTALPARLVLTHFAV